MLKEECKEYINSPLIVLKEKRSAIRFSNIEQFQIVKVEIDDCQLKDDKGKKCDFLLLKNDRETFVELKGSNISKAIKQLEDSIYKVSQQANTSEKSAFIVCSRSPLNSAEISVVRRSFKKKFNASLIVTKSNKQFELK